jgi:hypothetical protein
MISPERLMMIIAWNPDGFRLLKILLKGQKFNADYHYSSVPERLSKMAKQFRNETRREMVLHVAAPVLIRPSQVLSCALS